MRSKGSAEETVGRLGRATTWLACCTLSCGALWGCRPPSGAVESALQDDLKTLRASIATERAKEGIDEDRAREIAQAVLERELASAREEQAVTRIRALRSCARPLYDALEERAEIEDEIGAEAALILLENDRLRGSALERHATAADGAWRAVAARDTMSSRARGQRQAFFADPDERVRRAALHAAIAAPDERDLDALLEVSRVDPDPLARTLAIRALGRQGTERVVLALKDRWHRADELLRLAIVDAWSQPASLSAGGKAQLLRLVESESGLPALQAARTLLQSDAEVRELAARKLLAAAREGSTGERRMALRLLPPRHPETLAVLQGAAGDADPDVRVLANARLLEFPAERRGARKQLHEMARGQGSAALQARAALAADGDASIVPLLQKQLQDERASHRKLAAMGLLRLQRYDDAAPILADESPSTRTELACQLVAPDPRTK